jgi:hypothetical protein
VSREKQSRKVDRVGAVGAVAKNHGGPYSNWEYGGWSVYLFSPDDPSYNILNSPAWRVLFYIGETEDGSQNVVVLITYGISGTEPPATRDMDNIANHIDDNWTCDPGAGYRVFYGEN